MSNTQITEQGKLTVTKGPSVSGWKYCLPEGKLLPEGLVGEAAENYNLKNALFRYAIEKKTGEQGSRIFVAVQGLNPISETYNMVHFAVSLYGGKNPRQHIDSSGYSISLSGKRDGTKDFNHRFYIGNEGEYSVKLSANRQSAETSGGFMVLAR